MKFYTRYKSLQREYYSICKFKDLKIQDLNDDINGSGYFKNASWI